MTIAATITAKQYTGNGVTTQFAFPNKIFAASDLVVTIIDNLGNQYPFVNFANVTLGLTYTVQGVDVDAGAIVVLSGPLTNLWTIDIRSLVPDLQSTSIKNQGSFFPELHEEAFDRATRMIQDLLRLSYLYGIHGPDIETVPWPALPGVTARKGMALIFDPVTGLPTLGTPVTGTITGALIASLLNPITASAPLNSLLLTAAEAAAGVTPTNFSYSASPCDVRRYGWSSANSAAQNSTALANAIAALTPYAGGPSSVVNLPSGTFAFNTGVIPAYVIVRGSSKRGTVLTHTNSAGEIIFTLGGSGVSLYHGCGLSDLTIQLTGTAGTCVSLQGTFGAEVSRCLFEGETISVRTTQGVVIDGYNASAFFNHIDDVSCNHLHVGFKQQSSGSQQPTQNYFTNCNGTGDVGTDTTSIGINHGDGVTSGTGQLSVYEGCNLENYNQGVHCTSVCGPAVWMGVRFEGNTTDIIYDSNASGQTLIGCNPETVKITDNTTDFRNRYFGCWVGSNATVARNQGLGIFGASAIADIPVTAIATAGQTGDLIQAKNSALTPIAGITAAAIVYGNGLRTTAATPTGTGTQLSIGNTTAASVGAAGGASALPATPSGYLQIDIGGVKYKLPYFAN